MGKDKDKDKKNGDCAYIFGIPLWESDECRKERKAQSNAAKDEKRDDNDAAKDEKRDDNNQAKDDKREDKEDRQENRHDQQDDRLAAGASFGQTLQNLGQSAAMLGSSIFGGGMVPAPQSSGVAPQSSGPDYGPIMLVGIMVFGVLIYQNQNQKGR